MALWQFWLLLFSLWHSFYLTMARDTGGFIAGFIGVTIWGGSFIMLLWSLFYA